MLYLSAGNTSSDFESGWLEAGNSALVIIGIHNLVCICSVDGDKSDEGSCYIEGSHGAGHCAL